MTIILSELLTDDQASDDELVLPFEARQKTRQRAVLASGETVGLKLQRGLVLRGGDVLGSTCGRRICVRAAAEPVSTVRSDDPVILARAAYHLGNRHVWVEIGAGYVRYLHDHVLDSMLHKLGVSIQFEETPFEPEAGAYSGGHHQGVSHDHSH